MENLHIAAKRKVTFCHDVYSLTLYFIVIRVTRFSTLWLLLRSIWSNHKELMVLIVFITLRREFWITNPRSGLAVHQLGEELRLNSVPGLPHHCSMISRLSIMIYDICLLSWCIVRFFRFRFSAFRLPLFRGNCVWWTDSLDTPNGQISFPKDFCHCV